MTLREMLPVLQQRILYDWQRVSAVMATLYNVNAVEGELMALDTFVPDFRQSAAEHEPSGPPVITDRETKRLVALRLQEILS